MKLLPRVFSLESTPTYLWHNTETLKMREEGLTIESRHHLLLLQAHDKSAIEESLHAY